MLKLPKLSKDDVIDAMSSVKPENILKNKYRCFIKYRDLSGVDRNLIVFCRRAIDLKKPVLNRLHRLSFGDEGEISDILRDFPESTTVFYIRINRIIRAWCLLSKPWTDFEKKHAANPTGFFVQQEYRQLGLATVLATTLLYHSKITKQKPAFYPWDKTSKAFLYKMSNYNITDNVVKEVSV